MKHSMQDVNDSRLKPIRACALMWGISRTGIGLEMSKSKNKYKMIIFNIY